MIDEEIRQALDVNPSPEFLARVRGRIGREPAPSAWQSSWRVVAAVAIAAGIVAGILVFRPSSREAPSPNVLTAAGPVDTSAAKAPDSASNGTSAPRRGRDPHVVLRGQVEAPNANARRETHAQSAKAGSQTVAAPLTSDVSRTVGMEPEVLLDPRETRALRQLISGVREGRIDLAAAQRATSAAPADPEPVSDIAIAPITIDPIAPQSGAEGVRP